MPQPFAIAEQQEDDVVGADAEQDDHEYRLQRRADLEVEQVGEDGGQAGDHGEHHADHGDRQDGDDGTAEDQPSRARMTMTVAIVMILSALSYAAVVST